MGLGTPYEQLGMSFAIGSFFVAGVPALRRNIWAWKVTATSDQKVRAVLAEKLYLKVSDLPSYADSAASQQFLARYTKAGAFWLCVPMVVAWYVVRQRNAASQGS